MQTENGAITVFDADSPELPAWECEVRACEAALRTAFILGDVPCVSHLLADDYLANSPLNKVLPKPVVLQLLGAGTIRNLSCDSRIESLRRYGDTAVVMGQDAVVDPPDGRRSQRRYTDVWQLQDRRWRLVARHAHVLA